MKKKYVKAEMEIVDFVTDQPVMLAISVGGQDTSNSTKVSGRRGIVEDTNSVY